MNQTPKDNEPTMLRLITDRDGPLSGRASLYSDDRELASAEAHAMTNHVRFGVSLDADDSSIHFSAAAGPYLSLKIPIPDRLRARLADVFLRGIPHREYDDVDVFEVSLHHGGIWWSIGHTTDAWSSTTPRWRSGSWNVVDALLGKEAHDRKVLSEHEVDVPMPERSYRWKVTLLEKTIGRPRWPGSETVYSFEAEAREGQSIPFPGKGENSWDCEDDAFYSISGEGRTVADAVTKVVGAVLRDRLRYGGSITMPRSTTPTCKTA